MAVQRAEGWRTVQSSSNITFLIKSSFNEEGCSYQLHVFDGSKFWREDISKDEFCKKCRDSNPKVEADCFYLFSQIQCKCEQLGRAEDSKLVSIKVDTTFSIFLRIKLEGGIPFSWTFDLTEDPSPITISQEIVLPLLSMAGELMHQREDLFGIITRKDNEIQDYKDQGAAASRRTLETSRFSASRYLEERQNAKDYLGFVEDPLMVFTGRDCQQLYRTVMDDKRRIGKSKGPALNKPVDGRLDDVETQEIEPTIVQPSFLDTDDQGDEMTRRQQIAGKLAGKASEGKAKKKRKMINL